MSCFINKPEPVAKVSWDKKMEPLAIGNLQEGGALRNLSSTWFKPILAKLVILFH